MRYWHSVFGTGFNETRVLREEEDRVRRSVTENQLELQQATTLNGELAKTLKNLDKLDCRDIENHMLKICSASVRVKAATARITLLADESNEVAGKAASINSLVEKTAFLPVVLLAGGTLISSFVLRFNIEQACFAGGVVSSRLFFVKEFTMRGEGYAVRFLVGTALAALGSLAHLMNDDFDSKTPLVSSALNLASVFISPSSESSLSV